MCYDVAYLTKRAKAYAERYGKAEDWEDIKKRLPPTYHASGFTEPDLPVITNDRPEEIQAFQWGFVPMVYAPKMQGRPMNTLNARDDKIFTGRSVFRDSAKKQRCLVMIDGFFDHHKKDGIAYPHYVKLKTDEPFLVGGLWQSFKVPDEEFALNTVTMVTGPANKEMAWVHNEPAYSATSRMIYIVEKGEEDTWLFGEAEEAKQVIKPLPDDLLEYYPSQPIKSNKKLNRTYLGNVPEILNQAHYPELETEQGSLF